MVSHSSSLLLLSILAAASGPFFGSHALAGVRTGRKKDVVTTIFLSSPPSAAGRKKDVVTTISLQPPAAGISSYGPENCVHVSRSPETGTCILETKCPVGEVLAQVDFGIVCEAPGVDPSRRLHFYGRGGFADEEAFDTGVACARCLAPDQGDLAELSSGPGQDPAKDPLAPVLPADGFNGTVPEGGPGRNRALQKVLELQRQSEGDGSRVFLAKARRATFVSSAGPGHCVSTYKSPAGTCMLETACSEEKEWAEELAASYKPGFTCVDAKAGSARHIYDVGTFGPEERFDSAVQCEACLALDTRSQRKREWQHRLGFKGSVVDAIRSLREDLKAATAEFVTLKGSVEELKHKVYDEPTRATKVDTQTSLVHHDKPAVVVHKKKPAPKKVSRDDVVHRLAAEERADEEIEHRRSRRHRHRRHREEEEDAGEDQEDEEERPDGEVERDAQIKEGAGLTEAADRDWASGESALSTLDTEDQEMLSEEDNEAKEKDADEENEEDEEEDADMEASAEEDAGEKEESAGGDSDSSEEDEDLEDVKEDAKDADAEIDDVETAEKKEGLDESEEDDS